ncbi:27260_t:CDS:1, partial [Gigaspora margarita]
KLSPKLADLETKEVYYISNLLCSHFFTVCKNHELLKTYIGGR